MKKTEVYSWRVAFELKQALEETAKAEKVSLAQLLERIVLDWLAHRPQLDEKEGSKEKDIQRQLHQSATQAFGKIHGGDPNRSQQVSQRVKSKLRESFESQRAH
ncbi:MAG: hypothetical protein DCF15_04380 [Phormidesmis priestleyi]|uniref:Uncharacterized protein n=1 Tax=Phormidesmis priestleyi TaxID=268141 RepID=A0A2W4ZKR4_9CYAN|nr:MAG: hypothetical protein DCF15_04380 [Phormidesmis priestleyi]